MKKVKTCSNDKPYITSQLKKLIRIKLNLLKSGKTSEANSLRKHIKKEIRKSASSYYKCKVQDLFSTKPKQWYNRIKKICGKTHNNIDFHFQEDPSVTANDLNRFLSSIVQNLPPLSFDTPYDLCSLNFPVISPSDVEAKIKNIKKCSTCPLDIPIVLIKAFADNLSEPLSLLFNEITSTGKFPNCWKLGFITPVKKKGNNQDFNGVRPITLTPVFSKLYESFLAEWLKVKVIPNVDQRQFGNLRSTSTTHYLVHLMDTICKTLEKPNTWLNVIAVDLQKAFDLINHNILLEKLSNDFQVDPYLIRIIASFLSNRTQVVKYLNVYSDPLPIYNGVPQGTLLGPILFLTMINNLGVYFPDRWKFVDDLTVLETCSKNSKSNPMYILESISAEALTDDMKVNPLKSTVLTINFLKTPPSFSCPIPPEMSVTTMKLLGVTISSDLKWDCHINDILKRANAAFSLLKLLKKFKCPKSHCLRIFLSFVRPTLEYACPVWHPGISIELSDRIEAVQKRCLRIIFNEGKVPYISLLRRANLVTLKERRAKITLRFANNALHNPRTTPLFPGQYSPL